MRCVAVDWSGRATGAGEYLWIAEARGGRLTFLESGRDRSQAIAWLIARARTANEPLVAGLDFSFSLPAWYCARRGWSAATQVWEAIAREGDELLATERPPFWGRLHRRPVELEPALRLRRTEREDVSGAKSTFQVGGAGAVGTGSLRGMRHLPQLAAAGFAVWPFDPPGRWTVLEIYPRHLYPSCGRVVKSSWSERHRLLGEWYTGGAVLSPLLERAAGSEDAFDAAVSALEMDRHAGALERLAPVDDDPLTAIEGRIWSPPAREP